MRMRVRLGPGAWAGRLGLAWARLTPCPYPEPACEDEDDEEEDYHNNYHKDYHKDYL